MNINMPIPEGLHRRLKIEAARRGVHLRVLVIDLLDEGLRREDDAERLQRVSRGEVE